jgi:short subunit dehydrogenase-like uncharacterized protein
MAVGGGGGGGGGIPAQWPSAGSQDLATQLNLLIQSSSRNMRDLIETLAGFRSFGEFTWPAASTVTVTDANVRSNSVIQWTPLNDAAAAMIASATRSPYIQTRTAGTSFTLSTVSAAAVGTEEFEYILFNPI